MEKDTREAIRSVVGSLPKIDQLKPEQEQALQSFVGGHDVVALLPKKEVKTSLSFRPGRCVKIVLYYKLLYLTIEL